jgi:predicted nucleotidyltransferase
MGQIETLPPFDTSKCDIEASYRAISNDPIVASIQDQLDDIVISQDVKILFACESGSRVWGFASKNSDYDVRYIYTRDPEQYLTVRERKDEIRNPIDPVYDLVGWDARKALALLAKSNPNLGEWLNTDQLYRADSTAHDLLKTLYNENFSPKKLDTHYRSMAKACWHEHLLGEQVSSKKYLYCARALLASEWLTTQQTFPSLKFDDLLAASNATSPVKSALNELVAFKRAGVEKGLTARLPDLDNFIMQRFASTQPEDSHWIRGTDQISPDILDRTFRALVKNTTGC